MDSPTTFIEYYNSQCGGNFESLNINCFVNDINNPNDDVFNWDGSSTDFSGINGTEGNSTGDINSQETRPDTEDINGDQFLDNIKNNTKIIKKNNKNIKNNINNNTNNIENEE